MPATPTVSLFHPKQKKGELAKQSVAARPLAKRSSAPPKPSPPTPSTPEPAPAESELHLPDGPYTEFKLVSSAVNGWKYDVMRFDSRKPVDILSWERPVKLNRKDTRKVVHGAAEEEPVQVAVKPMLGPDGKPVIGADGRVVMVDAEGKPIHNNPSNGKQKGGARRKMQKKTKQVFKVADSVRQLRKEERYQWVMEDASGTESWTAMIEDTGKAQTHAFFMPASNNTFKFVPAHRWYKFQKKGKHNIPSLEEAEKLVHNASYRTILFCSLVLYRR
jgi:transcription initiation factor TFIIF subunit alpha